MKAVILAGGQGTRGKPFTDYFPKAMIPIEGKPLIDHIVQYLSSFGFIEEIIILADFTGLGGQIKSYFENRVTIHKKRLVFIQDSNSGTGSDLVHITNRLKKNSEFLLWFVDNLVAIDLTKMYKLYKDKKNLACVATRRYRKEETGYAIVRDGLVIEFKEKPLIKMQMAECLGVYILNTKIVKTIKSKKEKKKHVNLSFDVLQELSTKKISAFDIGKTPWIDVDSPIKIERNHTLVKEIIKKM
ncbi:MAG TPA: sugar phosphate nucleotidyltransferase, partial [Nitrosopumilaceae archaeon]|nr:sugar phosphate nucleotidyltransferase [Nitrosopumilaceae archaeon]